MDAVFALADRISVLVYGRIIARAASTTSATIRKSAAPIWGIWNEPRTTLWARVTPTIPSHKGEGDFEAAFLRAERCLVPKGVIHTAIQRRPARILPCGEG